MTVDLQRPKDVARLPTNAASRKNPIHRWFNFIAGFSPEFVELCIREAEDCSGGYLLDPFAGTGTALLSAQVAGLDSVGYEPHPFFAEMARAKLAGDLTLQDVAAVGDIIDERLRKPIAPEKVWEGKALLFLQKLIPRERLGKLAGCPEAVGDVPQRLKPLFHLIVSRILEAASGSATDGIYKAPTSSKRGQGVISALEAVTATIASDLEAVSSRPARAILHQKSALTDMPSGASLCVTSPPYLNNFDFAEMTRMELYFWKWARSWGEITQTVRSQLLTNTTTAPKDAKYGPEGSISLPEQLDLVAGDLYDELAQACKGRSKDYHRLLFPYLEGLHGVFGRTFKAMRSAAPIHVVVADSAFYGIHVPLHDLTALSLREAGFADVNIEQLRVRGNRWALDKRKGPPGTLGEYWVSASR